MKITIESTSRIVQVSSGPRCAGTRAETVSGRVWQGTTESGLPVMVVITSIAVPIAEQQAEFQREFQEHAPPRKEAVEAFPLRFVI